MGERDAFGREKGEDSLAQMGWTSGAPAREPATVTPGDPPTTPEAAPAPASAAFNAGEATAPAPRPEPASAAFNAGEATAPFSRPKPRPAEPAAAEPPRQRPPAPTFTRRPRRRGPSLARLIFFLGLLGVLAIGASKGLEAGKDAVDDIRTQIEAVTPETATPSPAAPGSLLRAAPLKDALTKLPAGKLVFVRIDANSIDAQLIHGGKRHTVHMSTNGPNADVTTPVGVDQPGFKLNPAAPLRATRTAARRAGLSVNDLDYIVGTEQGWTLFFKDGGPRYRASLSGRKVTKF
jgi:hypothetical protein